MGMRLLTKKEVNQKAQEIKKAEQDEGKKLAKQITAIRRIKAEEELSLEKFRSETVARIQAELKPLQDELETTKKELTDAKKTRDELLKPLDAEWEEVKNAKEEAENDRERAKIDRQEAETDRAKAKHELTQADRAKVRALSCEEVAQDAKKSAIIMEREARETLEKADTIKREADIYKNDALATVAEEHRKLDLRTEALVQKEKQIAEEQEFIRQEKIRLQDNRETLERALKRKS